MHSLSRNEFANPIDTDELRCECVFVTYGIKRLQNCLYLTNKQLFGWAAMQ